MHKKDWDRAEVAPPSLLGVTRRSQLAAILPSFLCYALIREVRADTSMGGGAVQRWLSRQQDIGTALMRGEINPLQWATEVERLAAEVDVAELMAVVAKSKTRPTEKPGTNDPQKRFVQFIDDQGAPRKLAYGTALFDFELHNVITPHGHKNMVSAHMVVRGQFRIRNFDRVRDEVGAMIIRPTLDYVAKLGQVSAMCSERNNIHWFVPHNGPGTTFDVVLSNLDQNQPEYEINAIDVVGGARLSDGLIHAPIMSFEDSSAKYTAAV